MPYRGAYSSQGIAAAGLQTLNEALATLNMAQAANRQLQQHNGAEIQQLLQQQQQGLGYPPQYASHRLRQQSLQQHTAGGSRSGGAGTLGFDRRAHSADIGSVGLRPPSYLATSSAQLPPLAQHGSAERMY